MTVPLTRRRDVLGEHRIGGAGVARALALLEDELVARRVASP